MKDNKVGKNLKKFRIKRGLTQVEVAERAEVNTNYYARIERDEVNPSLEIFEKILKALRVKSSDILSF